MANQDRRQFLKTGVKGLASIAGGAIVGALSKDLVTYGQQPVYTPEQILQKEFDFNEAQWKENINRFNSNQPLVDYTQTQLSPAFDINDLAASLGGRWIAMPQLRKDSTLRSWLNTPYDSRRTICTINQNAFRYFATRLPNDKQAEFNEFNAAYLWAIKNYQNPSSLIFASNDGSITRYLASHHQWIWLNLPSTPDRLILFRQAYMDNPSAVRVNFPVVKDLARRAFSEKRD